MSKLRRQTLQWLNNVLADAVVARWSARHPQVLSDYVLRHGPATLGDAERWAEVECILTDWRFLEAKNEAGLVFELAADFSVAVAALQPDRPMYCILALFEEAVRRDIHFIARHARDYPQALFQCLWNTCWWYDCPATAPHCQAPTLSIPEVVGATKAEHIASFETWLDIRLGCDKMRLRAEFARRADEIAEALRKWFFDTQSDREPDGDEQVFADWWQACRPAMLEQARQLQDRQNESWIPDHGPWAQLGLKLHVFMERWREGKTVAGTMPRWARSLRPPPTALGSSLAAVFRGHKAAVTALAFAPNGHVLASASADQTLRLWDAHSGAELAAVAPGAGAITSVSMSADGSLWAAGVADGTVRLFGADGSPSGVLRGHEHDIQAVAFSPCGTHLASGGSHHTIRIWDARLGTQVAILEGHRWDITALAFSPDGQYLLSGAGEHCTGAGEVRIWDVKSGSMVRELIGHEGAVRCVAFSPNGRRVASGGGEPLFAASWNVRIWDAVTGQELHVIRRRCSGAKQGGVAGIAFSPDGHLLAIAGDDHVIDLHHVESGARLSRLVGHCMPVSAVAFSPDGEVLASASTDRCIMLFRPRSREHHPLLQNHRESISALVVSPDGRHIASADSETIRIWSTTTGMQQRSMLTPVSHRRELAFSPEAASLATACGIFQVGTGLRMADFRDQGRQHRMATSVAFSSDGSLLALGTCDHAVQLRDVLTGKMTWQAGMALHDLSFDGQCLAVAAVNRAAYLWNMLAGDLVTVFPGCTDVVAAVALSPAGDVLAAGACDGEVRTWRLSTASPLAVLSHHNATVFALQLSPNGLRMASKSERQDVCLWDTCRGKLLAAIDGHPDGCASTGTNEKAKFCFSPDGRFLACTSLDGTVRLLDSNTGHQLGALGPYGAEPLAIRFAPDSLRLAVLIADGWIGIYHTLTVEQVAEARAEVCLDQLWFTRNGRLFGSARRITHKDRVANSVHAVGTVCFWEFGKGYSDLILLPGGGRPVAAVDMSRDGRLVAIGYDDGTIVLYETGTRKVMHKLAGHRTAVEALSFSADESYLLSHSRGAIRYWNCVTGGCVTTIGAHEDAVNDVCFLNDNTAVASVSDDATIRIFDAATGMALGVLNAPEALGSVARVPDDDRIVVGTGGHINTQSGSDWSSISRGIDGYLNHRRYCVYACSIASRKLTALGFTLARPVSSIRALGDGCLAFDSTEDSRIWDPRTSKITRWVDVSSSETTIGVGEETQAQYAVAVPLQHAVHIDGTPQKLAGHIDNHLFLFALEGKAD